LAPTLGAQGISALDVLKENGLRRTGSTYVLPAESELAKKLNAARAAYKQFTIAVARQEAFEFEAQNQQATIQELVQQRSLLSQQLPQATTTVQHNQIVGMLNEVGDRLNLLRQQAADPTAKQGFSGQLAQQREAFTQAILDLRQLADATAERYKALASDAAVQGALADLNKTSKTKLTLGPSRSYLANVKLLEKAERSVLTDTITLRRENGVLWVDVTFNGKITRPLVFDTGAADVCLSSELAARIGLKPDENAPTVRSQVADGRVVQGKMMTIPSMRVGRFTVKDVACAVLPGGSDIPPLLGGSFLHHFTFKMTPGSGKLVLTKVETEESPRGAARPKSTTRREPRKSTRRGTVAPPAFDVGDTFDAGQVPVSPY
jgi:clan AA aspartic protease (TIGR02281 family)